MKAANEKGVLAVMDRATQKLRGDDWHGAPSMEEARATVAELVEAAKRAEDRLGVVIECDNEDNGGASPDDVAAWDALRAALARAQGGAA